MYMCNVKCIPFYLNLLFHAAFVIFTNMLLLSSHHTAYFGIISIKGEWNTKKSLIGFYVISSAQFKSIQCTPYFLCHRVIDLDPIQKRD